MVVFSLIYGGNQSLSAQELLSGKKAVAAVEEITKSYRPWRSASWNGRLKSDMLPVSVTVKAYMLRDSLTLISLRAPLVGEVARVEIDNKSLLIANKMNKRYVRYDLGNFGARSRMVHSNLQDILIGRVTVIGKGTLSKADCKEVDIYSIGSDGWLVAARLPEEIGGASYGYAVDTAGQIFEVMTTLGKAYSAQSSDNMPSVAENVSVEASAEIRYNKSVADADIKALLFNKEYTASLQGMKIEWNATGFGRIDISRYSAGSLRDILKF